MGLFDRSSFLKWAGFAPFNEVVTPAAYGLAVFAQLFSKKFRDRHQGAMNGVQRCSKMPSGTHKFKGTSYTDAVAESLAPPEPGKPPRPRLPPFISAAGSLRTASHRPVPHAESFHAAERILGVRHRRPFMLARDG